MAVDAKLKFDMQMENYEAKKKEGKKARKPKPAPTFEELKGQFGESYRQLVIHVKEELANFEEKFPELKDHQPEIAGFIWHQGFNDKIRAEYRESQYADYTKWLAAFIRDIRKDLIDMPFIIGELSTGEFRAAVISRLLRRIPRNCRNSQDVLFLCRPLNTTTHGRMIFMSKISGRAQMNRKPSGGQLVMIAPITISARVKPIISKVGHSAMRCSS